MVDETLVNIKEQIDFAKLHGGTERSGTKSVRPARMMQQVPLLSSISWSLGSVCENALPENPA